MQFVIAVVIFMLWLLGFLVFHIAGGLIYLVLVVTMIVLTIRFVTRCTSA